MPYFDAPLDELRVYDHALDVGAIAALARNETPTLAASVAALALPLDAPDVPL